MFIDRNEAEGPISVKASRYSGLAPAAKLTVFLELLMQFGLGGIASSLSTKVARRWLVRRSGNR